MSEKRIEELNSSVGGGGVSAMISVAVYYPERRLFHDERKIVTWSFKEVVGAGGKVVSNPRRLDA